MKIIYTDAPKQAGQGEVYRRLSQFFGVVGGATSVVIEGAAPHIEAAYAELGVPVQILDTDADKQEQEQKQEQERELKSLKVPELKALAEERGIEFASNATKAQLIELLSVDVENEPSEGSNDD